MIERAKQGQEDPYGPRSHRAVQPITRLIARGDHTPERVPAEQFYKRPYNQCPPNDNVAATYAEPFAVNVVADKGGRNTVASEENRVPTPRMIILTICDRQGVITDVRCASTFSRV